MKKLINKIMKIDEKSILKKQSFRLRTKDLFLTYPQSGKLEIKILLEKLKAKIQYRSL